jgi:hypothetical protein
MGDSPCGCVADWGSLPSHFHTETYVHHYVKLLILSGFDKNLNVMLTLVKLPNIKLHENPLIISQVTFRQTDMAQFCKFLVVDTLDNFPNRSW